MVMAEIYLNCGKYDKVTAELELALAEESSVTVNSLKHTHWLDPVRDHGEYARLMRQYALAN